MKSKGPPLAAPRSERLKKLRDRRVLASLALLVAVLALSSFVVGDVILSYVANGSAGTTTSPFYFQDGADFAAANTLTFITVTCSGGTPTGGAPGGGATCGGTAHPAGWTSEAITVNGAQSVPSYLVDVEEFSVVANFPSTGSTSYGPAAGAVTTAWTNVNCAYAYLSTVAPVINPSSLSAVVPSGGGAAGCGVFEPTVTSATAWYQEDINLLTGASANPAGCTGQTNENYVGGACGALFFGAAQGKTAAATVILYISFVIVVSAAAPTGTTALEINPVVN